MDKTKRIFLTFIILFISTISAWTQEVQYEGENNGKLMLSVVEGNVKKEEAIALAVKDAYFQILFRGIPDSKEYKKALLGTDENKNDNRQYYDNMLVEGRLFSFVSFSALSSYKKKTAIVRLTMNVQALVADLEKNNLYRRFGLY